MADKTQVPEKLGIGINAIGFHSRDTRVQVSRDTVKLRREQFNTNLNGLAINYFSEQELEAIMPSKKSIKLGAKVNVALGEATSIHGFWNAKNTGLRIGLDCAMQNGQVAPYIMMDITKKNQAGSIVLEVTQRNDTSVTQELKLSTNVKNEGILFVVEGPDKISVKVNGPSTEVKKCIQAIYGDIDFDKCEVDPLYVQELYAQFRQELFRMES